jgi:glucosyl-3-phosphoglycerate phosphatase
LSSTTSSHEAGAAELIRLSRAKPLVVAARSFVFVRHGETDGNRQRVYQVAEQPLNANGLAQARRAADALKSHPAKRIYASTMPRAWRTAEIIAAPHGLPLTPSDHVRERWFGSLVGSAIVTIDWAYDPPGGETLVDFVERTRRGFSEALTDESGTLVVAHGGNLRVLSNGLGLDLPQEMGGNASPLLFERAGASWNVTPVGTINPLIGVAS